MNEDRRWRRWRALFLGTLLAALLMMPLTMGTVSALAWHTETADATGDVGWYSSLALDNAGNPRISYLNRSNYHLKYARLDGSGWHNETVDATGYVGYYSSLALDNAGNPRISYLDGSNFNPKYARLDGSGWQTETADVTGYGGEYSSLALDNAGNPRISYLDGSNFDLKYAWKDGEGWHNETVDAAGHVGWFSSLALDDAGNPRIGYYDETNYDLKYAWADLPTPTPTPSGSASFAAYPQSGPAPHTVQFLDYTPNAKSWRWEFGDGGSSTLQYPTHLYNRSGLYTVSLTVTDWADVTSTKTEYHLIRVTDPVTPAPTPVANFSANATAGAAPLAVGFTDASSPAPYHRWWTFGDGSSSTDASPVHTYTRAGTYTVNLTAWTSIGTASTTGTITVGADARAPVANFTMSRSSGTAPLYVKFTDTSTGAPTTWRWSFGGLAWTTATNPSVIFRPGEYAITLTAANAYGSSTVTKNLSVTGSTPRSVRGSAVSVVG